MMAQGDDCDDIQFMMFPFDRRAQVLWGMPRRPRDLQLFVPHADGITSYAWGTSCTHSRELCRSILTFALNHIDICPDCGVTAETLRGKAEPTDGQISYFLGNVVRLHSQDSTWEITLAEVREWLEKS